MLIIAGSVLTVSLLILLFVDITTAKNESEVRLRSLAKVIGANSRAAISFLDKKAASEVLATLETQKNIVQALLILKGMVFRLFGV